MRGYLAFVVALVLASVSTADAQRRYWATPVDTLAAGRARHTHVEVRGLVTYTRLEDDGDLHIRLRSLGSSGAVVIAECIPKLPCRRPAVGDTVTVRGVSRRDPEHGWYEVHPVEEGPE